VFGAVAPGRYHLDEGGLPPDDYDESRNYGAKEVRDSGIEVEGTPAGPVEISLRSSGGTVTGFVKDSRGDIVPESTVVLIRQDRVEGTAPLSMVSTTDQDGSFSVRGVIPGMYLVLAWKEVQRGAYESPDFLKSFENRGRRIRLDGASTVNLDLRVIADND
jgi:hypothetical protein